LSRPIAQRVRSILRSRALNTTHIRKARCELCCPARPLNWNNDRLEPPNVPRFNSACQFTVNSERASALTDSVLELPRRSLRRFPCCIHPDYKAVAFFVLEIVAIAEPIRNLTLRMLPHHRCQGALGNENDRQNREALGLTRPRSCSRAPTSNRVIRYRDVHLLREA
jgi:hypothetical protein